jgi:phosphate transport system permease protein
LPVFRKNANDGSDRPADEAGRSERSALSVQQLQSSRRIDAIFSWVARAAGIALLGILAAIAIFLIWHAIPAFGKDKANFWTSKEWSPDGTHRYGIVAIAAGTLISSAMALVIAVPVALGVAIFITEYAPKRIARPLSYITDTLAGVPSVVFGLWGAVVLVKHLVGVEKFLNTSLGWIPLFSAPKSNFEAPIGSLFATSVILAIMILPIIAAISREVLKQVDPAHKEAALALGATKFEMVRTAMLPPSRSGIVAGIMLGLGRALGETIAVALVLGTSFIVQPHILQPGGTTIAANIALSFGEAGSFGLPALIASGLVLFFITLVVNLIARAVIYRAGKVERAGVV